MNINEKFGFDSNVKHSQKYGAVVDLIGKDRIARLIPLSPQELSEAFKKDKNLNNIPLKKWDAIAGVHPSGLHYTISGELPMLLAMNGITSFSPSDLVCILKECARQVVAEYDSNLEKESDDVERE